jgi:hypothetical protein
MKEKEKLERKEKKTENFPAFDKPLKKIKNHMSAKKYRPSNGSEGEYFMSSHCYQCIHDNGENKTCGILMRTMCFDLSDKEYPEEWTFDDNGKATCTAWKKWDWGKDDDGNWIEPPPLPVDNPNQLCMPFIFDELEIQKSKTNQDDSQMRPNTTPAFR